MKAKIEDGQMEINLERRLACPYFSGKTDDYNCWRVRVADWQQITDVPKEKQGIQIRMALDGNAFMLVKDIQREELMKIGGEKIILDKLDKKYKGDVVIEKYNRIDRYLDIERQDGESMSDFISRDEEKCEEAENIFFEEIKNYEDDAVEGLLDTGCKHSVIGKF